MNQIVILAGAESNLLELFKWYEEREPGAGVRFHDDCQQAFKFLQQFPYLAPVFEPPFHRFLLKHWKVGIYYTVEGSRIMIQGAHDLRQHPDLIRRLLGLP